MAEFVKLDWNVCVFKTCNTKKGDLDENKDKVKLFCFPKNNDARINDWIEKSSKF